MLGKIPNSHGLTYEADFSIKKGTKMVAWKSFKDASEFQGWRLENGLFCSVGILQVNLLMDLVMLN